ncbi:MAG: hypothetical protein ACYDHP_02845 [Ferrimicrobium sp.]
MVYHHRRSVRHLLAQVGGALCIAIVLSSCGGARSLSGTSAANCVRSLKVALAHPPRGSRFRGLAEVPASGLSHFKIKPTGVGPYCVVFFLERTSSRSHFSRFRVEVFDQPKSTFVGSRTIVRRSSYRLDLA